MLKKDRVSNCQANVNSCNVDSHYSLTNVNGIDKYKWNSNAVTLSGIWISFCKLFKRLFKFSFDQIDILNDSRHELVESVQFNYLFEIDWLMRQYSKNK